MESPFIARVIHVSGRESRKTPGDPLEQTLEHVFGIRSVLSENEICCCCSAVAMVNLDKGRGERAI